MEYPFRFYILTLFLTPRPYQKIKTFVDFMTCYYTRF